MHYNEDCIMSKKLWCEFRLAYKLKQELDNKYRIVYDKPAEDHNYYINERTEILMDDTLLALPPL